MHCDRCNIDFPEGLRYCKWCGQPLNRPRTTSELHVCASCGDAIQAEWAFCKSCGAKLVGGGHETASKICPRCGTVGATGALKCLKCGEDLPGRNMPRPQSQVAGTSVIAHCGECGEVLDPGTVYCKACGAPTHGSSSPFGASSLLCSSCGSRNPVGSTDCRVCGGHLSQASPAHAGESGEPKQGPGQENTLPDLADHLPKAVRPAAAPPPDDVSGARTLVFEADGAGTSFGESPQEASARATVEHVEPTVAAGAETAALTGDSTSDSDQSGLTSELEKARTTAPVESAESTALTTEALIRNEAPGGAASQPTGVGPDATVGFGSRADEAARAAGLRTVEHSQTGTMGAAEPVKSPAQPGHTGQAIDARQNLPRTTVQAGALGSAGSPSLPQANPGGQVETVSRPTAGAPPVHKAKSNTALISIIVALIVVGTAGYLVYWFVSGGARPTVRPEVATPPAPVVGPPAETPKPPQPPDGMVLVPAGNYTIGRDEGDPLESPAHVVNLKAFFIDRTEVTNAQYKKFVDATGHAVSSEWIEGAYPAGQDDWPVTGVSWQDAVDYAQWVGKRLPTEAEWEAAARGADGRLYPWGNDWRGGIANIASRGLVAVGQFKEGVSPVGALDMIGNVWEWTTDEFQPYPGSVAPMPRGLDPAITYRVIRGGAFDGNKGHNSCYRGFIDDAKGYDKTGFRCVKSVDPSQ